MSLKNRLPAIDETIASKALKARWGLTVLKCTFDKEKI